ncbi:unnamed protein product [Prorocentrum cordatum]|uniref:Uncharacterized protein n=1 Tax=Prorocentrum cordatum TaxID=2364126 RepID=A0ABN9RTS8_9DINO|nr:unnamed protein product [Polarella glacialis]
MVPLEAALRAAQHSVQCPAARVAPVQLASFVLRGRLVNIQFFLCFSAHGSPGSEAVRLLDLPAFDQPAACCCWMRQPLLSQSLRRIGKTRGSPNTGILGSDGVRVCFLGDVFPMCHGTIPVCLATSVSDS